MVDLNDIQKIPLLDTLYRKHYFDLKRRYWNFVRNNDISPGPYTVHWISTFRCDSNCVYCEASANEVKGEELTTAQIKAVIDDLGKMGTRQFFFAGGEALLRRDLFELMDYVHYRGIKIFLITNSLKHARYKEELKNARINTIWTSVDGLPNTHNRNRGFPNAYKITFDAIRFYREIEIPTRVVNTFVNPENLEELPELFEELKRAGITRWRLALAIPVGRAADNKWELTDSQTINLFRYLTEIRKVFPVEVSCELGYLGHWDAKLRDKPFFCFAGLTQCAILPFGDVLPCQTVYNTDYSE